MIATTKPFASPLDHEREQRLLVRREGELYATTCICGYFAREGRPTRTGGYTSRCRLCRDRVFTGTSRELAVLYGIGCDLSSLPLDRRAVVVDSFLRAGASTLARLRWEELRLSNKTRVVAASTLCCPGCGELKLQIRRDRCGRIYTWCPVCDWRTFTASSSSETLHVGVAAMLAAGEIDWMGAYRKGVNAWAAWTRRPAELMTSGREPRQAPAEDQETTTIIRGKHG